MIRGSLDFDLEFLRNVPGNLAECCRTSVLSGTREVDILEGEGFSYTRWLDAGPSSPSGGRGLGLGRRSWRSRQGWKSIVGAGVRFLLRRLTGSRRGHGSRTRISRQAGEWIRGTLEFVPLLIMFAKKRSKIPVGNTVRNTCHLTAHTKRQPT